MTETKPALASENCHWYTKQGEPRYEVAAKNGQMRPTTLRDARKLDLVPSVTTILRCAAAPGLEAWKARQLLEAALTLPKLPDETLDDYATRVIEDSKEQGRKAAEAGTALHAAIEHYIATQDGGEWSAHCVKLLDTLDQYGIALFDGRPEHSFASTFGFGGKIDWHNDEIVLDFKTTKNVKGKKQLAWHDHCWQLAAYSVGIHGICDSRLINVFIDTDEPEVRIHEWNTDDALWGWNCFERLLDFWKLKNKYNNGGLP